MLVPINIWLGLAKGIEALSVMAVLLIYNWSSDSLDGPLSRRSLPRIKSWIGEHDLHVDMLIGASVLAYLALSDVLSWQLALLYLLLWLIFFWLKGVQKSMGAVFQALVYLLFIITVFREATFYGWVIVAWMVVAMALTWPKFPKVIVPDFLNGLRAPREEK